MRVSAFCVHTNANWQHKGWLSPRGVSCSNRSTRDPSMRAEKSAATLRPRALLCGPTTAVACAHGCSGRARMVDPVVSEASSCGGMHAGEQQQRRCAKGVQASKVKGAAMTHAALDQVLVDRQQRATTTMISQARPKGNTTCRACRLCKIVLEHAPRARWQRQQFVRVQRWLLLAGNTLRTRVRTCCSMVPQS